MFSDCAHELPYVLALFVENSVLLVVIQCDVVAVITR